MAKKPTNQNGLGAYEREIEDSERALHRYASRILSDIQGRPVLFLYSDDEPTRRIEPIFKVLVQKTLKLETTPRTRYISRRNSSDEYSDIELEDVDGRAFTIFLQRYVEHNVKKALGKTLTRIGNRCGIDPHELELNYGIFIGRDNQPEYGKIHPAFSEELETSDEEAERNKLNVH